MPGEDLSLEGNDLALASDGLEVRRNSAQGTALCFWNSPLLVGAPEPDRIAYRYCDISFRCWSDLIAPRKRASRQAPPGSHFRALGMRQLGCTLSTFR